MKFQRGWLKKESRKKGNVWLYRFMKTQAQSGKRVESKLVIGPVSDFPTEAAVWGEVERLGLNKQLLEGNVRRITFEDLALHYEAHELGDQACAVMPKSHTTINGYQRAIHKRLIPRWGKRPALTIGPLEIELWLKELRGTLENPTIAKVRNVMKLVYQHGQRVGLIPADDRHNPVKLVRCKTQSDYESMTVTPEQTVALLGVLREPERTLTLLVAATGLRISEALGLQWQDLADRCIYVRRVWTRGRIRQPKTRASKATVPMHEVLADALLAWRRQTLYSAPNDWIFPSQKLSGRKPRVANMLVEDFLRPAAIQVGILTTADERRFGFHTLRHSISSWLVRSKTDVKTVQSLLRHADISTTLNLYTHAASEEKLLAQQSFLDAMGMKARMVQ